eukprot:CAMPEP_0198351922 /NCGR_PEP_ID=MMETSP1450-20131203/104795_1 /TAXON_ID=753684 ORGANISM="Madagascaria erythrocladiodes, Strain CCMP3234" /NCGR_SAMPLE_ID=MMETSP1450 /ASSEMBLY_ACC=CAM_ASM_001115 /LENGTH=31 /DNA_ID= /DNA_START= /DNA_END= /DNA_ORIENTATION=
MAAQKEYARTRRDPFSRRRRPAPMSAGPARP